MSAADPPRGDARLRSAGHPRGSSLTPIEIQIRAALGALAWNVREWRAFRHATAARIAEMAQLSLREVQRIEAGTANPRLDTIVRLAFALKVDQRDLFAPLRR